MTRPALSVVETLYDSNCRDALKMAKKLAHDIEAGEYGDVTEVVAVIRDAEGGIKMFGFGEADAMSSIALLEVASTKLKNIMADMVED